jgi:hypothetical protein
LFGQVITDENCPTVAGSWAPAEATAINCATAKQPSTIILTFSRSEEREQEFGASQKANDFRPIVGCITSYIRKWRAKVRQKLEIFVWLAKEVWQTIPLKSSTFLNIN